MLQLSAVVANKTVDFESVNFLRQNSTILKSFRHWLMRTILYICLSCDVIKELVIVHMDGMSISSDFTIQVICVSGFNLCPIFVSCN